jgi:hypothetical protein
MHDKILITSEAWDLLLATIGKKADPSPAAHNDHAREADAKPLTDYNKERF